MSMLGAVNAVNDEAATPRKPSGTNAAVPVVAVAGRESSTTGGTVKWPSLTLAVQVKTAPTESLPSVAVPRAKEKPVIWTFPVGSPPVHVTSWPLARVTVVILDLFDQVRGFGSVRFLVNAPTSAPPGPLMV